MKVTATLVRQLREQTGLGMMDCKNALAENECDLDKAQTWLRKRGAAKADKKAGRDAAEGTIAAAVADRFGALIQVNTETDFVARTDDFQNFAQAVADAAAESGSIPAELSAVASGSGTVEQLRHETAMRLGENIQLGRAKGLAANHGLHSYVHHDGSIGVLADISCQDESLGRDICLHIAALMPEYIREDDMPAEAVEREREIYAAQVASSDKPAEIIEKMIEGRMRKFLAESTLLSQPFVKDPTTTVGKHLEKNNAQVSGFCWLALTAT